MGAIWCNWVGTRVLVNQMHVQRPVHPWCGANSTAEGLASSLYNHHCAQDPAPGSVPFLYDRDRAVLVGKATRMIHKSSYSGHTCAASVVSLEDPWRVALVRLPKQNLAGSNKILYIPAAEDSPKESRGGNLRHSKTVLCSIFLSAASTPSGAEPAKWNGYKWIGWIGMTNSLSGMTDRYRIPSRPLADLWHRPPESHQWQLKNPPCHSPSHLPPVLCLN